MKVEKIDQNPEVEQGDDLKKLEQGTSVTAANDVVCSRLQLGSTPAIQCRSTSI